MFLIIFAYFIIDVFAKCPDYGSWEWRLHLDSIEPDDGIPVEIDSEVAEFANNSTFFETSYGFSFSIVSSNPENNFVVQWFDDGS